MTGNKEPFYTKSPIFVSKPKEPDKTLTVEQEHAEFDSLVRQHNECHGASKLGHGCACIGLCLGSYLAKLRLKYDHLYPGKLNWWSDQLHGALKKRPGDHGHNCAPLNADNYWIGTGQGGEYPDPEQDRGPQGVIGFSGGEKS